MKVKYIEQPEKKTLLKDIGIGTVFAPIGTNDIYIKLDHNGGSDFLTNNCAYLWSATNGGYEGEDFETRNDFEEEYDYEDLILCADVQSGNATLLFKHIEVEILNCELVIKRQSKRLPFFLVYTLKIQSVDFLFHTLLN